MRFLTYEGMGFLTHEGMGFLTHERIGLEWDRSHLSGERVYMITHLRLRFRARLGLMDLLSEALGFDPPWAFDCPSD